jgi:hypothetical protein
MDTLREVSEAGDRGQGSQKSGAPAAKGNAAPDLRIGRVVSVTGARVIVLLEENAAGSQGEPTVEIGQLVKMPTQRNVVIGMVAGHSIPMPARQAGDPEMRLLELELVGECVTSANGGSYFRRGVSAFPVSGNSVFGATGHDLQLVYDCPGVATARIGVLHQDRSLAAHVRVDDLLGKHFAVLGSTGSGKSCAVALILHAILGNHQNAHVLLLDPHNEYARAFPGIAEVIDHTNLQLPYWLLNFEELCEVLKCAGAPVDAAEVAVLNEIIPAAKREFLGSNVDARHLTCDTPSPYRMSVVIQQIEEAMGRLEKPDSIAPYQRLKIVLNALMSDARFAFMFSGGIAIRDSMTTILSRIFRIPVRGKPITILDMSALSSEVLNVVAAVLSRIVFEFALWSDGQVPILLICEEAHRYAPDDSSRGFEPTKRALARIAKEGRKYALSLCVVSQRPSELAGGLLSQCSTIFALRLSHQRDQELVRGATSEAAFGLFDALSSLGNAEAIAVGEGVPIPMRLAFDQLAASFRPKGSTATFSGSWRNETPNGQNFLDQVVTRWRQQRR